MTDNPNFRKLTREDTQDWSRYKNLSKESRDAITPTEEFNKSRSIATMAKIGEQAVAKAQATGDRSKLKEAQGFAARLMREESFIRNSK